MVSPINFLARAIKCKESPYTSRDGVSFLSQSNRERRIVCSIFVLVYHMHSPHLHLSRFFQRFRCKLTSTHLPCIYIPRHAIACTPSWLEPRGGGANRAWGNLEEVYSKSATATNTARCDFAECEGISSYEFPYHVRFPRIIVASVTREVLLRMCMRLCHYFNFRC